MVATVVYEPGVVKMTAIKVGPVVPFKERTIVREVETIPVVTVPGRVVIISVPGEFGFANCGSGIITIRINRCGCGRIGGTVTNGGGSDNDPGCGYIEPGRGNPEADVCAYEHLCITPGSDEAGGYDGTEDK
jgi:hypothetical protein